jgi:hypothetical protein
MLANQLINVIRLRSMDEALQKQAGKWTRTLDTVDWLTAQLPVNAQFQVMTFNTEAAPVLPGTQTQWLEVADTPKLEAISAALRERVPAGGTSLYNAFEALRALPTPPDNIFLLTDGLPTQAERPPRGSKVSGNQRLNFSETLSGGYRAMCRSISFYFLWREIRWRHRNTGSWHKPPAAAFCHPPSTGPEASSCDNDAPHLSSHYPFWM